MSWRGVLGHDAAAAFFISAWKRGRVGHAFLFVGPKGVGKHTFARELAKALLCEDRREPFEACDQCDSCTLVAAGTHPDLFMVSRPPELLEFPIKVIKEDLLPNLAMKPARGSRKIAIVDDADDLNEEAANCFLKTLEEPPPGSVLILVGGSNIERQLPTILSRCQAIRFSPIAPAHVKKVLIDHGITEPARQDRLLQLAGGSPGQALALDDEEVWEFRKQLLESLRQEKIDPAVTSRLWMEFINGVDKEAASHRQRASLIVRMILTMLNTALKLHCGTSLTGLDSTEEKSLRAIATRLGEERILAWIERALEADRQIDRRVQLVLVIEGFVDTLARN